MSTTPIKCTVCTHFQDSTCNHGEGRAIVAFPLNAPPAWCPLRSVTRTEPAPVHQLIPTAKAENKIDADRLRKWADEIEAGNVILHALVVLQPGNSLTTNLANSGSSQSTELLTLAGGLDLMKTRILERVLRSGTPSGK